ncbi:MAG TPA: hypothetical protein DGH68_04720, partial [Bacteroidetes bacterium]|nr:hypothetical protein [Bacteroidota bacterium]
SISIETVETEVPSPFAASMLFDFVAVYMYEWDQPREDRQSQYLSINRELLSEVIDTESIASLLRPEAVDAVEQQLQRTADGYKARSPEELLAILLRLGDLTNEEMDDRCLDGGAEFIHKLRSNGRAVQSRVGNGERWIAGEEIEMYEGLHEDGVASMILLRYLQNHGPTTSEQIASRYGIQDVRVERLLTKLSSSDQVIHARLKKDVDQLQWCYRPNLERIHRQTIGILRKEIQPSSLTEFTDFLFRWQHLHSDRQLVGSAGLQQCLEQLQALPLLSEVWERDIIRTRVRDCSQELLNQSSAAGTVIWTGKGSGRMQCTQRGEGNLFLNAHTPESEAALSVAARRILEHLEKHGASFFTDIRAGSQLSLDALNRGIAELFWTGRITNDSFSELQNVKRLPRIESDVPIERIEMLDPRHNPRKARLMGTVRRALKQVPGWSGRWSLAHLPGVMGEEVEIEERAHQQAIQLLDRYGIVARELYRRENLLPWALIASALQHMEMRGEIRRGYFVQGLSGMQFALPAAAEELRRVRSKRNSESSPLLVNACDPANPYGTGLPLPAGKRTGEDLRFARISANYVAFHEGTPIFLIENYASRLWTLAETTEEILIDALRIFVEMLKLPQHIRPVKSITIEHCDGMRPVQSPLEPVLRRLGFTRDRNQTMIHERYV